MGGGFLFGFRVPDLSVIFGFRILDLGSSADCGNFASPRIFKFATKVGGRPYLDCNYDYQHDPMFLVVPCRSPRSILFRG